MAKKLYRLHIDISQSGMAVSNLVIDVSDTSEAIHQIHTLMEKLDEFADEEDDSDI